MILERLLPHPLMYKVVPVGSDKGSVFDTVDEAQTELHIRNCSSDTVTYHIVEVSRSDNAPRT